MKSIVYKLILLLLIIFPIIYANRQSIIGPTIKIHNRFLHSKTCKTIIDSSTNFKKSGISTKYGRMENKNRTSSTMVFRDGDNIAIDLLKKKVGRLLKVDPAHFEPIQVTKYDENQEYKYHHDYFGHDVKNQRRYTALLYLNTIPLENGGATSFLYGNSIQPKCGKLICWENTNAYGIKQHNTLHSGTCRSRNVSS
jgi:hypothetical protein